MNSAKSDTMSASLGSFAILKRLDPAYRTGLVLFIWVPRS